MKKLPCKDCITLAMCRGRANNVKKILDKNLENPYHVPLQSETDAIAVNASNNCSIIKEFLQTLNHKNIKYTREGTYDKKVLNIFLERWERVGKYLLGDK